MHKRVRELGVSKRGKGRRNKARRKNSTFLSTQIKISVLAITTKLGFIFL